MPSTRCFCPYLDENVILYADRRRHIVEHHPEIRQCFKYIPDILGSPDEIRKSQYNINVLLFYKWFDIVLGGKYLVVVVDRLRKSVLTVYSSDRQKLGETVWRKV
ncbi:MAG: hypothetical protein MN733_43795 [Nitrososphaera sp.]|nr:hypothetical protein [Nitrososphaera sp.]